MENAITNIVAELLIKGNKNLSESLKAQDQKLKSIKCTDKTIGSWIEDFELPFLLELLDAPDSYISENFPHLASFDHLKRQALADQLQNHAQICEHCKLKIYQDAQFENLTESMVEHHRESLKTDVAKVVAKTQKGGKATHTAHM